MLLLIGLILLIIGITKLSKANTIKKEAYELEQKNDEKLNKLHDRERFILSKEETLSDLNKQITMLKNDIILLKKEKEDLVKSRLLCKMLYNVFTISTYQN
ncbi:TPA: chromosome segregation protein [Enterococcus faecium]